MLFSFLLLLISRKVLQHTTIDNSKQVIDGRVLAGVCLVNRGENHYLLGSPGSMNNLMPRLKSPVVPFPGLA